MVELSKDDNTLTACISGDIDHHSAKIMRDEIDAQINLCLPKLLKLDFKDVSFMDSSGIGLIMGRYKYLKMLNGQVWICNASYHLKKVMKLAGLDKLITFEN